MVTQINDNPEDNSQKDLSLSKGIGSKRSVQQVVDTIYFEFQRNLKRALIMLGVIIAFFVLNYYLASLSKDGPTAPTSATDYITGYLGLLPFLILILCVGFGSQMLVVDFQQQTGNILFPKITRGRLMLGRYIANFVMIAIEIIIYYLFVFFATILKFTPIPVEFWYSMGWALFYAFMLFVITGFFSSFMSKPSSIVVIVLLLFLIGLDMIIGIMSILTSIEPFFLPNHYRLIIASILNMPSERKFVTEFGEELGNFTITTWLTPSELGAGLGMSIYSIIFLIATYYLYQRRQNK